MTKWLVKIILLRNLIHINYRFAKEERFPPLKEKYVRIEQKPKKPRDNQKSIILEELEQQQRDAIDRRQYRLEKQLYKEELSYPGPGEYDILRSYGGETVLLPFLPFLGWRKKRKRRILKNEGSIGKFYLTFSTIW